MSFNQIIWDDPDDPEGNVQHVAEHGLTIDEVEYVLQNPTGEARSHSSDRPCCFGYTPSGEHIIVVMRRWETTALIPSPPITFPNRRWIMSKKKHLRVVRKGRLSPEEAARLNDIRSKAMADFPPDPSRPRPAQTGVAAQIRAARQAQGLTWYAVAKLARIPNPATIRDIEYGRDAKLSNIEAVAAALGLKLELTKALA